MAADWFQTTVGNYCPFLYGKGLPREKRIHGDIPVVSSAGISGLHDQALVQSKGVVIGRKGTVGSITYCDKPFWPIDTTFYVPDEPEKRDVRFTYYLLKTIGLETMNSDSAVPGLNRDNAHAVEIKIPALAEQKRIASILGALDDKIELNRRMNAKLEDMARTLFKSWFVDFDPVRAKLDGRPPAGMDAATAELFADAFEETVLGLIPKGWQVCPLSEKIQLLSGGTPKTSESTYWDGDIPWYSVRDAPSETDVWVTHTDKKVTSLGIASSAAQILPEKTTIISARGTVGKLALTAATMAMNQSCYGVRSLRGDSEYFIYYLLRESTAQLQQRTHGTVFDTITTDTFKTLDCIFAPRKVTAEFDKYVEPALSQMRTNLRQSRIFASQRDRLLQKLFIPQLSVNQPNPD